MPLSRSYAAGLLVSAAFAVTLTAEQDAVAGEPEPPLAGALHSTPGLADRWTGPYVGIGFGARWTNSSWSTTCLEPALSNCSPPQGIFPDRFANDNPAPFDMSGMQVRGYAGYNWQTGNLVAGLEGDIAWADDKTMHNGIPGTWQNPLGPGRDTATVTNTWDGSVRGRIGVLAAPNGLIYATAGVAWLRTTASASCQGTFPVGWCVNSNSESATKVLPGWTIGAGVELRVSPSVILRGEYRYTDYQDFRTTFFEANPVDSFRFKISQRTHTVYLGISHLF